MSAPATLVESASPTVSPMSLDDALAKRLRRAADHQERWLKERDELIRLAHIDGASYREIAAAAGLSHVGVMKIVNKGTSLEPPGVLDGVDPARRVRDARTNAIKRQREQEARDAREQGQGS